MARDARAVLSEILDAISLANEAAGGMDLRALAADRIRSAAAVRALEVVSEAARHLPTEITDLHPEIPWIDVKNIGNKLRHEYHRIDMKIVADIIAYELEPLRVVSEAEMRKLTAL